MSDVQHSNTIFCPSRFGHVGFERYSSSVTATQWTGGFSSRGITVVVVVAATTRITSAVYRGLYTLWSCLPWTPSRVATVDGEHHTTKRRGTKIILLFQYPLAPSSKTGSLSLVQHLRCVCHAFVHQSTDPSSHIDVE